jgi:hypothetical protein
MPLPAELENAITRYCTWIDGELQREQEVNKISDTLYHYTNVAGLEGIIKSEAVWFTDFPAHERPERDQSWHRAVPRRH